jgi:hypothetical protein
MASLRIVTLLIIVLSSLDVSLGVCPPGPAGTTCSSDLCLNAADLAVLAVSTLTGPYCGTSSGIVCQVVGSECRVVSAANYLAFSNCPMGFLGPISLPYLTLANDGLAITNCNMVSVVNFPALQQVYNGVVGPANGLVITSNLILTVTCLIPHVEILLSDTIVQI